MCFQSQWSPASVKWAGATYGYNMAVSDPNFLKWSLNSLPFFPPNFIIANVLWLCCCNNGFLRGRHLEIRKKKSFQVWEGLYLRKYSISKCLMAVLFLHVPKIINHYSQLWPPHVWAMQRRAHSLSTCYLFVSRAPCFCLWGWKYKDKHSQAHTASLVSGLSPNWATFTVHHSPLLNHQPIFLLASLLAGGIKQPV